MAAKTPLFHGCARSELTVFPANWQTKKARTDKPWRIVYRFYDPATKGTKAWGKQVAVYGMNEFKELTQRQQVTRQLLANELEILDRKGYNPITGQLMAVADRTFEIHPDTDFLTALRAGLKKITAVPDTLKDMGYVVEGVAAAAAVLYDIQMGSRYNMIPISQIKTRHIKYILEQCGKDNPRFSNNRFNMYKAYLSMIFNELVQLDAIESNPTRDIPTRKKMKRLRAILTPEEQVAIDGLKHTRYTFWRYLRIFFRSGSRTTEMLALKKEKVDLQRQEFVVTIKKGKNFREDMRPIPDDVLPLWGEIMAEAKEGQYLFSVNLKPGDTMIRKDQPTRRWAKYVKATKERGGLGINKDFYALKHLHSDMIADQFGLKHAQTMDGHTNARTTMIYAVGEDRRRKEEMKRTVVKFA